MTATQNYAIVNRNAFTDALAIVSRIAEKRSTIPILSNVLIDSKAGGLYLRSTNLNIECTVRIDHKARIEPFMFTVPGQRLLKLCKEAVPSTEIKICQPDGGGAARFMFGDLKINLNTLPVDDFPNMVQPFQQCAFLIKTDELHRGLTRTFSAISTEETRYSLNGVLFQAKTMQDQKTGELAFTATDGHRLHQMRVVLPKGAKDLPDTIVPRQMISELIRLCEMKNVDERIKVSRLKGGNLGVLMVFTAGDITYVSKPIDGSYPDYQRVIPSSFDKNLVLDRAAALGAIKAVTVIRNEKGYVKMVMNGKTKFIVTSPNNGSAELAINGQLWEKATPEEGGTKPAEMEIGFNSGYLQTMLSEMQTEEVRFDMNGPGDPAVITSLDEPNTTFVLMPMRI